MKQAKAGEKHRPHSDEFFTEHRSFWWNSDFLKLQAKRLSLKQVHSLLDVGCGVGHFSKTLIPFLAEGVKVSGVDWEEESVRKAREDPVLKPFGPFVQADAADLPFDDNQFDMVACQTLLLHVPDPRKVLQEMKRVLKPGGLLLAVEPNNTIAELVFDTMSIDEPLEDTLRAIAFYLRAAKGQMLLKKGCDMIGDLLPHYFKELDLIDISVVQSDKTIPLFPPYETPEQKAYVRDLKQWLKEDLLHFEKGETLEYTLAAGGNVESFESDWEFMRERTKKRCRMIEEKRFSTSGGTLFYLVSGKKNAS